MISASHPFPERLERRIAMTYEEYLAMPDDGSQVEWVDGEAIVFVPQTLAQARSKGFLSIVLGTFARHQRAGEALMAPFEMRLTPRASREPDIVFVVHEHRDRVTPERLEGPADLVIEIVSDDSVVRDRAEKLAEYAAAGIPEYWIHDPRPGARRSDFYRRPVDGRYEPIPPDAAGRVHSTVLPGFWLRPEWLRRDPLPDPLACLTEIDPGSLGPAPTPPLDRPSDDA